MATATKQKQEVEVLIKYGIAADIVYNGKSNDYDSVKIVKATRAGANGWLQNLVGDDIEIQTHVNSMGVFNKFPFTVNLDIPGDSIFVVLAKLPEESSLSPLGFYATEDEARTAIAYKGFTETDPIKLVILPRQPRSEEDFQAAGPVPGHNRPLLPQRRMGL